MSPKWNRPWSTRLEPELAIGTAGSGVPVVLLHGQPGSRSDWRDVARNLAADHFVVVPDRLGWGGTGGKAAGFFANANSVARLVKKLGVEKCIVVGHSWAGGVALSLSISFPNFVSGLVLVSSVAPDEPLSKTDLLLANPLVGKAFAAAGLSTAGRLLSWGPGRAFAGRRLPIYRAELAEIAKAWRRPSTWDSFAVEQRALAKELPLLGQQIGCIAVPTVVVVGSADRVVRPEAAKRLVAAIPGASLEVVEGAGHLLPQLQPARVATIVRRLAGELHEEDGRTLKS